VIISLLISSSYIFPGRIIAKFFPSSWPTTASIVTNGVQRELLRQLTDRLRENGGS
jgi:hypothetical protein